MLPWRFDLCRIRVDFLKLSVDHILPSGCVSRRALWPHLEAGNMNPLAKIGERGTADRRHQQGKPDPIREKSGRQKKRASDQDHRAMRQWFGRIVELFERIAQVSHGHRTLSAYQPGTKDCRQDHDPESWPQPKQAANLNEQSDLDQRNGKKRRKQPHMMFPQEIQSQYGGLARDNHLHKCRTQSYHAWQVKRYP